MNKPNVRALSRRELLKLAGASAAVTMMAACAPAPAAPGQPGAAPAAKEIKLAHWQHHSASRAQTVEQFKARFEDENKNVKIDFQSIPWADYWGKLASAIAAGKGSAPDVFQIPMGLVEEYVAGNNLLPVSNLVLTSKDIEETVSSPGRSSAARRATTTTACLWMSKPCSSTATASSTKRLASIRKPPSRT